MATIRVCGCVCGRVSVQEVSEKPCCPHCEEVGDNVDWFNVESITFRQDLKLMQETLDSSLDPMDRNKVGGADIAPMPDKPKVRFVKEGEDTSHSSSQLNKVKDKVVETTADVEFHDISLVGPDTGGEPINEPEKQET